MVVSAIGKQIMHIERALNLTPAAGILQNLWKSTVKWIDLKIPDLLLLNMTQGEILKIHMSNYREN